MTFPDAVSRVTVELDTGQWTSFTKDDLIAVDEFVGVSSKLWPLLAFITSLGPMPGKTDEPSLSGLPDEDQTK